MEKLQFVYHFRVGDEKSKRFVIELDKKTLNLINPVPANPPDWTRLNFYQCPNCTLNKDFKYCPVAVNLVEIIDFFSDSSSFENADIMIETEQRNYSKLTSLQQGVSSMIGIIMATSGCPILKTLKPMVKFHLPFASNEETLYRTVSMYLVKQYFRYIKGLEADWELKKLVDNYHEIHKLNQAFYDRIAQVEGMDANVNAIIILDNFANYVNFSLDTRKFKDLEKIFQDNILE